MLSIKKNYVTFYNDTNYCIEQLKVTHPISSSIVYLNNANLNPKYVYIKSCGFLNQVWQSWNGFWRSFWLTHFYGGMGYKTNIPQNNLGITGLATTKLSEEQAIYFILQAAGFNVSRFNRSGKINHWQEPTWGDQKNIEKLSIAFSTPGSRILSALSVFGDSAKDLQAVRNCSIHMNKASLLDIKSNLIPRYIIPSFKYPTDIIFSTRIGTRKVALNYWTEELVTLLELLE
ncbi:hypothetical protein ASG65_01405 [Bacillus sp. Leaf13]|nr:hypothetical protein ASG65_01405 [Bacillus sp. Leaf13]